MYGTRQIYQVNRNNKYDYGAPRTTTNTSYYQSKIEKPSYQSKYQAEPLKYNRYGLSTGPGRSSAVYTTKRDTDIVFSSNIGQSKPSNDYNKNNYNHTIRTSKYTSNLPSYTNAPNITSNYRWSVAETKVEKEPIDWRKKYGITIDVDKPKEPKIETKIKIDKIVKEEKTPKYTPYTINTSTSNLSKTTIISHRSDKKVPEIKSKITVTKTENEIPDKNKSDIPVKEEKIVYNYDREKLGLNKTDEDIPRNKNAYKEEIIVSTKKRLTSDKTPDLTKYFEKKIENKYSPTKIDDKKNTTNKNEIKENKVVKEIKETTTVIKDYKDNKGIKDNKDNKEKDNKYETEVVKTTIIKTEKVEDKPEKVREPKVLKETKEIKEIKVVKEPKEPRKPKILNEAEKTEKMNRLKIALNEIEDANAKKLLKENLVELFEKILDYNLEFKDEIFFKNLNDTERKVGNLDKTDKRAISHTYKEIPTSEVIKNIPTAEELLRKYTQRARRITVEE